MTPLISHRSSVVTPDTAEALRLLEREGAELGDVRIKYKGVPKVKATWSGVETDPGPTDLPAPLSMRPTGREVYLSVELKQADPLTELATLWSIAVPLGFMPLSRYPVPGPHSEVFHYLGPWASVTNFLHGEGRGDHAWPSMCAAAQCDVGTWEGTKPLERGIQSNLHRLGINCGPIDGEIGERTLSSLKALGLGGLSAEEVSLRVSGFKTPKPKREESQTGFLTMKGQQVEAFCSGEVHALKTRAGYSITTNGRGRLILLFGDQA